jgi:hypothetical protein
MDGSKQMLKTVLAAGLLVMAVIPAGAQELLTNGGFTTDLAGWTGSGSWDSNDYLGSPGSGSATYICQDPGTVTYYIVRQCVDLASLGEVYMLSGYFYIPAGQSGTGWGQLGMAWYSAAGCDAASYVGGADAPSVSTTGQWLQTRGMFLLPTDVVSVYVYAVNTKTRSDGVFQVATDELSFFMLDKIFTDGFESGNTTAWSITID